MPAAAAASAGAASLRILSWNLLAYGGAGVGDIRSLVLAYRPDLLLLQEATAGIDALPGLLGGHYVRRQMPRRSHGLACWSPRGFVATTLALPVATRLDLPFPLLRLLAPRLALVVSLDGFTVANIHLDHGQLANRRQLRHLRRSLPTLDAVVGDYNALGRAGPSGFRDVGPREATHRAYGVVPLRLDRCLVRGLDGVASATLAHGTSDHRPILVELVRSHV